MVSPVGILGLVHVVLVAAAAARILLREDISGSGRLAWLMVILSVPFAGLGTYALFGERFLGRRARARRRAWRERLAARPPGDAGTLYDTMQPGDRAPFRYGASINGFSPVGGNRAELIANDDATLRAMLELIDGARDSIHVLSYIWLTDTTGTLVAQALMRAAGRGVAARVMVDHVGSRRLTRSRLWRQMAEAGVETRIAMKLETIFGMPLVTRFDLRNHRKLIIADDDRALLGSRNIADPEFAPKKRFGPWIDIAFRIEGPVVEQAQLLFTGDWMLADGEAPEPGPHPAARPDGFVAQMHGSSPFDRLDAAQQMFCTLFAAANRELIITTPYFVPDMPVLQALKGAAHRGVRVVLILPARNDSWVVKAASHGTYRALLETGVEIHEHRPGLLHAKTLTIDGRMAMLGSSNLDMRSLDLNFEDDLLIADEDFAGQVRARQMGWLAAAAPVQLEHIRAWSAARRAWNNVVATVGPVL